MNTLFWVILAIFYLALTIASFVASKKHSVETKLKHSVIEIEGKPFMKATYDYLNANTWINAIGFFLAFIAAILSGFNLWLINSWRF